MNPNKWKRKNKFIFHSILVRRSDEKNQSISVFEEFRDLCWVQKETYFVKDVKDENTIKIVVT